MATPSPMAPDHGQRYAFHIRAFQQRDLKGAHAVLESTIYDYGEGFRPILQGFLDSDMSDIDQHYLHVPRSNFWCVIEGTSDENTGTVIGIVGIRPMAVAASDYYCECLQYPATVTGQSPLIPFDPTNTAELNRMAVLPRVRFHGVARALIQTVVDWCASAGYEGIHLTTSCIPSQASKFWLKCKFYRYRILRHCFEDHEWTLGNHSIKELNDRLRSEGNGALLESKFSVSADEIPDDSDLSAIARARASGVIWLAHFWRAVKPASPQSLEPAGQSENDKQ